MRTLLSRTTVAALAVLTATWSYPHNPGPPVVETHDTVVIQYGPATVGTT